MLWLPLLGYARQPGGGSLGGCGFGLGPDFSLCCRSLVSCCSSCCSGIDGRRPWRRRGSRLGGGETGVELRGGCSWLYVISPPGPVGGQRVSWGPTRQSAMQKLGLEVGGRMLAGCLDMPAACLRGLGAWEDIELQALAGVLFWAARGGGSADVVKVAGKWASGGHGGCLECGTGGRIRGNRGYRVDRRGCVDAAQSLGRVDP